MPTQPTSIAITGMGAITPLGDGVGRLWKGLLNGECAVARSVYGDFPTANLVKKPNPFLSLEEALPPRKLRPDAERCALVLATTKGDMVRWLADRRGQKPSNLGPVLANLSHAFAKPAICHGPVLAVSAACASGSQAVIEACEMLLDGDADEVVAVGIDVLSDFIVYGFGALQALSRKPARPFDASRDGLNLGEAAAAVVLRRANDTDRPLALITGWGSSNDANHISGPSRDGHGLSLAIDRALKGHDRRNVRGICAHGTATRYNDAMEAHAFHKVWGETSPPVFGIKGSIGHTLGAAALVEVIVSAQVAREKLIPPTVGFEAQDPAEPKLDVVAAPREIKPGPILSTNSGFGGINTALLIEGAP